VMMPALGMEVDDLRAIVQAIGREVD